VDEDGNVVASDFEGDSGSESEDHMNLKQEFSGSDNSESEDDDGAPAVPPVKSRTLEGEFIIEAIVDGPNKAGKYLAKWENYSSKQNTWEPEGHLPKDMIEQYHIQKCIAEEVPLCKLLGGPWNA
jgi:hypothetical protein